MLVAHYAAALTYILAGAVVALLAATGNYEGGRWLPLHLVLIGGVSQLVIATAQFFAAAFFATDLPARGSIRAQLVLWNVGAIVLILGIYNDVRVLTDTGSTLLAVAVAMVFAGLAQMQRVSLQQRRVMVRWYYTCLGFFLAGMIVGVTLASTVAWTQGDLLSAHITLMLGGWLGTAIVGTLHTFFPSITGTMLAQPRLEPPTYWAWIAGVVTLTAGLAFALPAVTVAGWLVLIAAASMLLTNIVMTARTGSLGELPATLVGAGQACLVAGLVLAAAATVANSGEGLDSAQRAAAGSLLLFGWVGMTVLGSLLRLLTVIGRVRNRQLEPPRVGLPPGLAAVPLAAVATLAVAQLTQAGDGFWNAAVATLVIAYAVLGGRVVTLAIRAARAARINL